MPGGKKRRTLPKECEGLDGLARADFFGDKEMKEHKEYYSYKNGNLEDEARKYLFGNDEEELLPFSFLLS